MSHEIKATVLLIYQKETKFSAQIHCILWICAYSFQQLWPKLGTTMKHLLGNALCSKPVILPQDEVDQKYAGSACTPCK